MKVLFLDIDGVLNTLKTCQLPPKFLIPDTLSFNQFDEGCVARLNEITDATGAKLVISSTWRIGCAVAGTFQYLVDHFKEQGVTGEIIGHTPLDKECGYISEEYPDGSRGIRGYEIDKWLENNFLLSSSHGEVEVFIILDDSSDMAHLMDYLVHITGGWFGDGVQDEHVDECIWRLGVTG